MLKNIIGELRDYSETETRDSIPVMARQTIKASLANIYNSLYNIENGNQHVQQLTEEVGRLHLTIWQGGFRYRGKKVVGYEAKYAQISKLAKEIEEIQEGKHTAEEQLEEVSRLKSELEVIAAEIRTIKSGIDVKNLELANHYEEAESSRDNIQDQVAKIGSLVNEATESASEAEAKAQSATTNEKRLQDFIKRVDSSEKRLSETIEKSNTGFLELSKSVQEFKDDQTTDLEQFIERLKAIEIDINQKLSKATGVTLFHSFDQRSKRTYAHWIWLVLGLGIFAATVYVILGAVNGLKGSPDAAFLIKLSLSLPAILIIGFALQQYSKERRLKEEYAFKSAISLSLDPYRKLVEEAVDVLTPEERVRFADFLITSISIIFESPTEKVFGEKRVRYAGDTKIISGFLENVKKASDIVKPH